jgi:hypothetical protein
VLNEGNVLSEMGTATQFNLYAAVDDFFLLWSQVFSREQLNGHYGVVPFALANLLSALPFLALIAIISSSICYNLVGLHPGFSHFVYFVLCLLACLAVVESLMMVVASIIPNFLMGIITGAGIQVCVAIYTCVYFLNVFFNPWCNLAFKMLIFAIWMSWYCENRESSC